MADIPVSFMDYVQHHERVWGIEQYPNRPTLSQILEAPVVVFWQKIGPENLQNRRFTVRLHDNLDEIEAHYTSMIFAKTVLAPTEQIHRIFQKGKRLKIMSAQVQFNYVQVPDQESDE
jgi:hypothetical protein